MKRTKTLMTTLAFALAIGGAFGFKSFNHSRRFTPGFVNTGPHTPCAHSLIPFDCAPTGTQVCTFDKDTYYQDASCLDPYFFSVT